MSTNEITVKRPEIINNSFGVYQAEVVPPCPYICRTGDKVFSRFFYVVSGKIIFDKGTDRELSAGENEIVFLPNDVTYKSEWDIAKTGRYIALNFVSSDSLVSFPDEICIVARDMQGVLFEMFENLFKVWTKGELGYEIEMLSGIYKVIHHIYREMTYKKIKSINNVIYKGIMYLENHYLEDVSVKQLADMCHTSEGNFRRLFKKYKNTSPISYRNYLRMKKALVLLGSNEYTISEVANAVNIPDIPYFYKVFVKTFGKTPKEYLNSTDEK